jgi:hypothetical protein
VAITGRLMKIAEKFTRQPRMLRLFDAALLDSRDLSQNFVDKTRGHSERDV